MPPLQKPLTAFQNVVDAQAPQHVANIRMSGVGVDEDTVTINGVVYHLSNGTAATGDEVEVDITGGQTAANVATALVTAITAQFAAQGIAAELNGTDNVLLSSPQPFTMAESLTNGTVDPATAAGGRNADEPKAISITERVPTAAEVTAGVVHVKTKKPISGVVVNARVTATNALKAFDGDVAYSGNLVTINNDGSTDFAATDTLTILVQTDAQ